LNIFCCKEKKVQVRIKIEYKMLVWLSWGDALNKQFGKLFVAVARECPYGTRAEEPWALPTLILKNK
jgi:hypothetical protein